MHRPLPEKMQNAPELYMGLVLYYSAFVELSPDRAIGFGLGPIPWTARQLYAEKNGFSEEQTEDLHFFIVEMDKVYLDYMEKKSEAK